MSLKAAVTIEFLGSLLISIVTGFYYSWDNPSNIRAGTYQYPRDAALITGGLVGVLTLIGFGYSGAHFNWVLTLPLMICRKVTVKAGALYMLAQLIAYALGGLIVYELVYKNQYEIQVAKIDRNNDKILRNPPFSITKATIYNDNDLGSRDLSQILSETVCTFMLVFGYFVATTLKNLPSAGVAAIMGMSYFSIVTHSVYASTGVVNPIKLIGYLYMRKDCFLWLSSNRAALWTLVATPIPVAIVLFILFPIVFIGRSPFYRPRAESMTASQLVDPQPIDDRKPLEEPLVGIRKVVKDIQNLNK